MLPMSLWLHVHAPERKTVRVWLPLFLVWLLLLPLAVLVLVVALLVDVFVEVFGISSAGYTRFLVQCVDVLANTRGLVVKVHGPDTVVDLTIL